MLRNTVTVVQEGQKTGALLGSALRRPAFFGGENGEGGIGHVERKFASDGERRAAQKKIVQMLHRFRADEMDELAGAVAGMRQGVIGSQGMIRCDEEAGDFGSVGTIAREEGGDAILLKAGRAGKLRPPPKVRSAVSMRRWRPSRSSAMSAASSPKDRKVVHLPPIMQSTGGPRSRPSTTVQK